MSGRPWYKRYGADFVHGCLGLTLEEKGAYSLCLDLIYDRGGPIPDDARWLAGVCGVSLRKWTSLRARLIEAGKLVEQDGHLSNTRAEKEIEAAAKTAQKLAESGSKGGEKRAENARSSSNNNEVEQASLKHTRINQKPEAREDRSDADASDAGARAPADDGWPNDYRERFWSVYPNKVGKAKVFPLLERIRKSRRVTFDRLMSGLDAYKASKPPDRQWCNPETWLNQGRWDDEPSIAAPTRNFERDREPTRSERSRAAMAKVLAGRDDSRLSAAPPEPRGPVGGADDVRGGDVLPLGDAPWTGIPR